MEKDKKKKSYSKVANRLAEEVEIQEELGEVPGFKRGWQYMKKKKTEKNELTDVDKKNLLKKVLNSLKEVFGWTPKQKINKEE